MTFKIFLELTILSSNNGPVTPTQSNNRTLSGQQTRLELGCFQSDDSAIKALSLKVKDKSSTVVLFSPGSKSEIKARQAPGYKIRNRFF